MHTKSKHIHITCNASVHSKATTTNHYYGTRFMVSFQDKSVPECQTTMEVAAVITGLLKHVQITCTYFQSDHHHPHNFIQIFTGRMSLPRSQQ